MLDIPDNEVLRGELAGLLEPPLILLSLKINQPLEEVLILANGPGDLSFEMLVSPVNPFVFAAPFGTKFSGGISDDLQCCRPVRDDEMSELQPCSQQILSPVHQRSSLTRIKK